MAIMRDKKTWVQPEIVLDGKSELVERSLNDDGQGADDIGGDAIGRLGTSKEVRKAGESERSDREWWWTVHLLRKRSEGRSAGCSSRRTKPQRTQGAIASQSALPGGADSHPILTVCEELKLPKSTMIDFASETSSVLAAMGTKGSGVQKVVR